MKTYYSFVIGLPDLEFKLELCSNIPALYPDALKEELSPRELEWAHLLWLKKYLHPIAYFLSSGISEGLPSEWPESTYNQDDELFDTLPLFLQKLVAWKKTEGKDSPYLQTMHRLQQYYFEALLNSDNRFIQLWGDAELSMINFSAAQRAERDGKNKTAHLIDGNYYKELLLEFSTNQKICLTEYEFAVRLASGIEKSDLLSKEMETDRMRWDTIDEINKFEYFTIDVVLGYFQKTLLLEKWKGLTLPEDPVNQLEVAKKLLKDRDI